MKFLSRLNTNNTPAGFRVHRVCQRVIGDVINVFPSLLRVVISSLSGLPCVNNNKVGRESP